MKQNILIAVALVIVVLGLSYSFADAAIIAEPGEHIDFPIQELPDFPVCKFGKKCEDKPVVPTVVFTGNQGFIGRGVSCVPTWTDAKGGVHYYDCYFEALKAIKLLK